jgi:cell division protein ZapA
MTQPRVVTVEIAGQRYPIKSTLDTAYVTELAAYVERKLKLASDIAPECDLLSQAILVALNLTDELFRLQRQRSSSDDQLQERTLRLERIVDDALAQIPRAEAAGRS